MAHWKDQFDAADLEEITRYLEEKGRPVFDPDAGGRHPDDVFFWLTREQIGFQMYGMRHAKRTDGRPFRCYPVIIDSPHPNAFACELNRVHLIGLNAGMATVAYELAAFAFSRRDTFLDIGNPEAEVAPPLPDDAMLGYWIFDTVAAAPTKRTPIGAELVPRDPVRKQMAYWLAHLLMRFTWFHEVFHCLNGHCAALSAAGMAPELHEMPSREQMDLVSTAQGKTNESEMRDFIHEFEFDADQNALRTMIDIQLKDAEPLTPFNQHSFAARLRLAITAAWLMTFSFEQARKRHPAIAATSHPLPANRLKLLIASLLSDQYQADIYAHAIIQSEIAELNALERHFWFTNQSAAELNSDANMT